MSRFKKFGERAYNKLFNPYRTREITIQYPTGQYKFSRKMPKLTIETFFFMPIVKKGGPLFIFVFGAWGLLYFSQKTQLQHHEAKERTIKQKIGKSETQLLDTETQLVEMQKQILKETSSPTFGVRSATGQAG